MYDDRKILANGKIDLLIIASGTIGDVLPIARLARRLAPEISIAVVTNSNYLNLFPDSTEKVSMPFDSAAVIGSPPGQRMIEGGMLGTRRLIGVYGVVRPQIRPAVETIAQIMPRARRVLIAGIPFGSAQIAGYHDIPVARVLYQPHWPNSEIKSLYVNSSGSWPKWANTLSHRAVDFVGRRLFRRELVRSLNVAASRRLEWPQLGARGRLLHESYYFRHKTILSLTQEFSHDSLRSANWAHFAGFIRPFTLAPTGEYCAALRFLSSLRKPIVYCAFGSMISRRTESIREAVIAASKTLNIALVTQGRSAQQRDQDVYVVPFGDHRLLFPICSALIHHGGAGTVVASLDSGRPFTIMPQWADQFYWADRTEELGLSIRHNGGVTSQTAWAATLERLLHMSEDGAHENRLREAAGNDGLDAALELLAEFCDT